MGLLDKLFPKQQSSNQPNWVEADDFGYFYFNSDLSNFLGGSMKNKSVPDFDPSKSMFYAGNLSEIFTPIDIIADGVSSVKFDLVDSNGDVIENIPDRLTRILTKPNPFMHFKELVYQIVFSELATGGSYVLTKMPSSYKTKAYDRISNIWVLNPDNVKLKYKKEVLADPFMVSDINEFIDNYKYHFIHKDLKLSPFEVNFNAINTVDSSLRANPPLLAVERNINNLLQVYSARYNIYKNNGSAGVLVKEATNANSIQEQADPTTRQDIIDDLNSRDGLTGNKNIIGFSSIPLKYVETLAKIKDLEPFKETYADAINIAGAYKVDKELIPKEQSTTFTNKKDAEKNLWQNTIMPYCEDVCQTLKDVYYLPEGWSFKPNYENIPILQTDRKISSEADKIELENIAKMIEMNIEIPEKLKTKWKL
jgi:hypothetical protein